MKINRCKSLFCSFKQVLKNIKNCFTSLNKNVIPESRNRESQPCVSSSRKVSVRDIGRFFIPRTTTLRGDGSGRTPWGNRQSASGFTLLEVIVALIIIGALLAFALPKYETALDKSRFSTLMPLTKSIKDAEEVFYIASNQYTEDVSSLDVKVNPGETVQVSVKNDDDYSYVQAIDPRIENIYKAYLKHSTNFPEERHCEALTDSTRAKKVCETLGGTLLDESGDYTVYVLEGTGHGTVNTEKQCEGETPSTEQACSSGCGTQTRSVSCDTSTGEWDLGEWSGDCAEQPVATQSCTTGVGEETRTVTCEDNTWVAGEWDKSSCTCDPDTKPAETVSCSDGCRTGTQTQSVTCDGTTWKTGSLSACSVTKPSNTSSSCSGTTANGYYYTGGTKKLTYTCSNGSWASSYNYSSCTGGCSTSSKPSTSSNCTAVSSSYTGGTATRTATCNSGAWSSGNWNTSGCCTTASPGSGYTCSGGSWSKSCGGACNPDLDW